MGRVYLALDTRLKRQVAIKVLTSNQVAGASALREAQMAGRLQHHNIAVIHDVIESDDGRLHIVMEHLKGRTLAGVLRHERLTVAQVLAIFRQILAAIEHAHRAGVIHCDLKPANVFVTETGIVKVLDFGLARIEAPSTTLQPSMAVAGTPQYMAPERMLGGHPDARVDVFSLGVVLLEMLRRSPIVQGTSDDRTTEAVATDDTRARRALQSVAARAAAHDADVRFASVAEMSAAVDSAGGIDSAKPPIGWRGWLIAIASLLVVAALVFGARWWPRNATSTRPILAVNLSAPGSDPMPTYVAAAMQQILERTLGSGDSLTIARRAPGQRETDDKAATHELSGTVERVGPELRVTLSVANRGGQIIASRALSGSATGLPILGKSVVEAAESLLSRAGLPITPDSRREFDIQRALSIDSQAFEEYARAREYMRSPDVPNYLDHALGLLQRAVEREPKFALAHAALAEASWQKYQVSRDTTWTDKARTAALEALRLDPEDPVVRYTLALIYRGMGRLQDALAEVNKAVDLRPASDEFYRLRGILNADLNRTDDALADFKTAIDLRPGYWENYRAAGLAAYDAGRMDDAIRYFRRFAEIRPSSASAFQMLGAAYQTADRIDDALEAYSHANALAPSANTYANIGKLHFDAGRFEAAKKAYLEATKLSPRDPVTYRNLGDTMMELGDNAGAHAAYQSAITLAGEDLKVNAASVDSLSLQALCYAKIQKRSEALQLVQTVLASSRLTPGVRYRVGAALVLLGEPSGAQTVAEAIKAGYSRSEARRDPDLRSIRANPVLISALDESPR